MEEKKIEGGWGAEGGGEGGGGGEEGGRREAPELPFLVTNCHVCTFLPQQVWSFQSNLLSFPKTLLKGPNNLFWGPFKSWKRDFRTNFGPVKLLVKATSSHFHFVQINKPNSDFSDHTVFNVSRYLVLVDSIVRKDESIWFKIYPMFPRSWRHCIGCIGLIGTVWMIYLIF